MLDNNIQALIDTPLQAPFCAQLVQTTPSESDLLQLIYNLVKMDKSLGLLSYHILVAF